MARTGLPKSRDADRARRVVAPERVAALRRGVVEGALGFLERIDGGVLRESAGLDDGVVTTRVVAEDAITAAVPQAVGGVVGLVGSTETEVLSRTMTTLGGDVEVDAIFHLTVWHPTAGDISVRLRVYRDVTVVFDKTFPAINGDLIQGWQTLPVTESLAAGTYTYRVTAQTSVSNWNVAETDAGVIRYREFKR